jgi:hypothetical protein
VNHLARRPSQIGYAGTFLIRLASVATYDQRSLRSLRQPQSRIEVARETLFIELMYTEIIVTWPPADETQEATIVMTLKSLETESMPVCSCGGTATLESGDRAQFSCSKAGSPPFCPVQRPLATCHRIVVP